MVADVSELVNSNGGLMSQSTHSRSFQRRIFPDQTLLVLTTKLRTTKRKYIKEQEIIIVQKLAVAHKT